MAKSHKPPLIPYAIFLLVEPSANQLSADGGSTLPAGCTWRGAARGCTSNLEYLTDSLVSCLDASGSAEPLAKSFLLLLLLRWRMSV